MRETRGHWMPDPDYEPWDDRTRGDAGALYAVYDSTGEQVADLGWQDSDAAALAAADVPPAGTLMRLEPATGRAFSVGPPRPA